MKINFGTIMGIIIIVTGIVLGIISFSGVGNQGFSGKEVFQTEEEYQSFKTAISDKDVDIIKMDILNQSTPIIINFEVRAPDDFPYGNSSKMLSGIAILVVGFVMGGMFIFVSNTYW